MKDLHDDGILTYSGGYATCKVLLGPSVNEEIIINDCALPDDAEGTLQVGEKHIVKSILPYSTDFGVEHFEITLHSGARIILQGKCAQRLPAGSSINIAFTLLALGIADLGILAPIGAGKTGKSLTKAMRQRELELLLFAREGSALTVSAHSKDGRSTLFCEKPPYHLGQETRQAIEGAKPEVIVATSIKPMDLELMEILLQKQAVKIFVPNSDLIQRHDMRERLMALFGQADLIQINGLEASMLLGETFTHDKIDKVAKFGAKISIVTLGDSGAVLMEQGKPPVEQEGFMVKALDTTGAGDVHLAVFIRYYYLREKRPPIDVCLKMANWIASQKVAAEGPWSGIPSKEERRHKLREWWPEGFK